MQQLSACSKRASEIQRRRTIHSSRLIALCPAGPPKLMTPSLSPWLKASARMGAGGADSGDSAVIGKRRSDQRPARWKGWAGRRSPQAIASSPIAPASFRTPSSTWASDEVAYDRRSVERSGSAG